MDKRNLKKSDPSDRKYEKKDRGDLKRTIEKPIKNIDTDAVKLNPERGDSKTNKDKFKANSKKVDDNKIKNSEDIPKDSNRKERYVNVLQKPKESGNDKKVKDKFILALKNTNPNLPPNSKKEEGNRFRNTSKAPIGIDFKNDRLIKLNGASGTKIKAVSVDRSTDSDDLKSNKRYKREKESPSLQRKPIIKTVTARNDTTKIYKAVTFVDQKRNKPQIQIKIPNDMKKKSETTMMVKKVNVAVSRISFKDKPVKKKSSKQKRLISSPDLNARNGSPSTEVAKWAPSSINKHTKPYYEAWVNTTLAAISKNSKKEMILEKQSILDSFHRSLLDRQTSDLIYENINDERYTGRIKVKQR